MNTPNEILGQGFPQGTTEGSGCEQRAENGTHGYNLFSDSAPDTSRSIVELQNFTLIPQNVGSVGRETGNELCGCSLLSDPPLEKYVSSITRNELLGQCGTTASGSISHHDKHTVNTGIGIKGEDNTVCDAQDVLLPNIDMCVLHTAVTKAALRKFQPPPGLVQQPAKPASVVSSRSSQRAPSDKEVARRANQSNLDSVKAAARAPNDQKKGKKLRNENNRLVLFRDATSELGGIASPYGWKQSGLAGNTAEVDLQRRRQHNAVRSMERSALDVRKVIKGMPATSEVNDRIRVQVAPGDKIVANGGKLNDVRNHAYVLGNLCLDDTSVTDLACSEKSVSDITTPASTPKHVSESVVQQLGKMFEHAFFKQAAPKDEEVPLLCQHDIEMGMVDVDVADVAEPAVEAVNQFGPIKRKAPTPYVKGAPAKKFRVVTGGPHRVSAISGLLNKIESYYDPSTEVAVCGIGGSAPGYLNIREFKETFDNNVYTNYYTKRARCNDYGEMFVNCSDIVTASVFYIRRVGQREWVNHQLLMAKIGGPYKQFKHIELTQPVPVGKVREYRIGDHDGVGFSRLFNRDKLEAVTSRYVAARPSARFEDTMNAWTHDDPEPVEYYNTQFDAERTEKLYHAEASADNDSFNEYANRMFVHSGQSRLEAHKLNPLFVTTVTNERLRLGGLPKYYYAYGPPVVKKNPDRQGHELKRIELMYVHVYSLEPPFYRSWYTVCWQVAIALLLAMLTYIIAVGMDLLGASSEAERLWLVVATISQVLTNLAFEYTWNRAGRGRFLFIHRLLLLCFSNDLPPVGNDSVLTTHQYAHCIHDSPLGSRNYITKIGTGSGKYKSYIIMPVMKELYDLACAEEVGVSDITLSRDRQVAGKYRDPWFYYHDHMGHTTVFAASQRSQVTRMRAKETLSDGVDPVRIDLRTKFPPK